MGRITGFEEESQLPQKVLQIYDAVSKLMEEGADMNNIRVSTITEKAGIGKGTAYDYFDTKEELIACAILFQMKKQTAAIKELMVNIPTFPEQVNFLFDLVGSKEIPQSCFLQYIHNLTDNSTVAEMVRKRMFDKTFAEHSLWTMIQQWLEEGIAKGEIRDDLPMDYMIYTIFARVATFLGFSAMQNETGFDMEKMRPYAKESILQELCKKNMKFSVDK